MFLRLLIITFFMQMRIFATKQKEHELMKKIFMVLLSCVAMVACKQPAKPVQDAATTASQETELTDSLCFKGEVPAADGPGIKYELMMATDSTDGFRLTETMLEADKGKDAVERYTGKAEKMEKDKDGKKVTAYKLQLGKTETMFFKIVNDSTLRLVNNELEEAEKSSLNYDLKLVK